MRFEGTSEYVATDDLKVAVNAAVLLRRPLLVKGEPGTGKTVLAHQISKALNAPLQPTCFYCQRSGRDNCTPRFTPENNNERTVPSQAANPARYP